MNQSAEGRIKSKYDSSNRKIKQLYQQFESLKSRINTPFKAKRGDMSFDCSEDDRSVFRSETNQVPVIVPRAPVDKKLFTPTQNWTSNFQIPTLLKSQFQKFLTSNMVKLDRTVDERCALLEDRLENIGELLLQFNKVVKLKLRSSKLAKAPIKCNCKWKGSEVEQVEKQYEKQMEAMKAAFESKISLLMKENNIETSASSNAKKPSKERDEQLRILEDRLLVKQNDITELKMEASRLRRLSDNNGKLLRDKQKLIEELNQQIKEKESHIKEMQNCLANEKEKLRKDLSFERDQHNIVLKKLQKELDRVNQINLVLQKELQEGNKRIELDLPAVKKDCLRSSSKSRNIEWNESQIERTEEVLSDFQNDQDNDLKIEIGPEFELLRHSHFVSPHKKRPFELESRLRQMESELQLLEQENKQLKEKKDKFEDQVKENESDEEKFQMQSQILRDQLKRVNLSLRKLDNCAVSYLRDKKVAAEKIEELEEGLEFKKALRNKFPSRKNSIQFIFK